MILDVGEKLHIVERRLFNEDLRRHFVGEVVNCIGDMVRAKGNVWIFDNINKDFIKKPEIRERIIKLGDRNTVNVIPKDVDLNEVIYQRTTNGGLVVTDGKKFSLDVLEFSAQR